MKGSKTGDWRKGDWERMRAKLALLSVDELKLLAERTGIRFTGGLDSLRDRPGSTVKDQILLVLDESDPAILKREYLAVIAARGK